MTELNRLIREAQNVTGAPWLNGEAYCGYIGYTQLRVTSEYVCDDLEDVIEWLRADGFYEQSDRLRTIRNRLVGCQIVRR